MNHAYKHKHTQKLMHFCCRIWENPHNWASYWPKNHTGNSFGHFFFFFAIRQIVRQSCEIPALRVFVSEYVCKSPGTYLCVFRYISKSDFFKKPQSPSKRERDSRSERQTEKVRERGQVFFPMMVIVPALCLQTDTLLKIPIGNGQHSIKSELSQSVVKRQATEIAVCARVWAGMGVNGGFSCEWWCVFVLSCL